MKNNDALKKHHFWILAVLAPLFVFLAVIFLFTGVDSAISAQKKDIDDKTKVITGAKAVGKGAVSDIAIKMKMLDEKKTTLWEDNWKLQATANQLLTSFGARYRRETNFAGLGKQAGLALVDSPIG